MALRTVEREVTGSCASCGSTIAQGERFCTACGAEVCASIIWDESVPILADVLLLRTFFYYFAATVAAIFGAMWLLAIALGDPASTWKLPAMIAGAMATILLVGFLGWVLIAFNRIPMRVTLSGEGASVLKKERWYHGIASEIGRWRTGPDYWQTIGEEWTNSTRWGKVRRVKVYRRLRVIALRNSWRTVLRIHCPAAEFERALAFVEEQVAEQGGAA